MNTLSASLWLRLAALYFLLGVALGIHMGASGDHALFPVHAHLNLLGWVSMTLFGLLFRHYPRLGSSRLAWPQFWLYNLGLPVMLFAVAAIYMGHHQFEPLAGVGSLLVGLAVLLFAINLFRHARD
ncbi:hypothetical protein [Vogesella sp. LIG4]|uniref:hypothetical protein n=1 Tax=Vogesella sp. LIG4 TaxID=1192162 RepID=UPI00081F772A|nr:hypothetical protein [Vogesella sp. LIG4]SCK05888.1 hypothetical protein PSELUDRAFT_0179 [Vogesella sp. LIG4]